MPLKGDTRPRDFSPKAIPAVITRKQSEARARERSLNQFLLNQYEEALRLLAQKEEIIRRLEDGERRYTCHGCHTTAWGVWSEPPEGWQLAPTVEGAEAHLCPLCTRPRPRKTTKSPTPLHLQERG